MHGAEGYGKQQIDDFALARLSWNSKTINYNDSGLNVASTTATIALASVPANAAMQVLVTAPTQVTYGMGASVSITIGHSTNVSLWMASASVSGSNGIFIGQPATLNGFSQASSTQANVYFTAGANLNTLTGGQLIVYYRIVQLW